MTMTEAVSQTLSVHTSPNLTGLNPDNHTIEEPTLLGLRRDVHEIAGYEITQKPDVRNNFILIHAKRPGKRGLRVVMKLPLSSHDIGQQKTEREFKLLRAAGEVTKYVPE